MNRRLTAIVEREGTGDVAPCPEVDVASQGDTVMEARANLEEALVLFFESASPQEIERRAKREFYITDVEVAVGNVANALGPRGMSNTRNARFHRSPQARQARHYEDFWAKRHGDGTSTRSSTVADGHTDIDYSPVRRAPRRV